MPKILAIADDPRFYSGIAIQSRKVYDALVAAGWEVVVIGVSFAGGDANPILYKGIKIYPYYAGTGYYCEPNTLRKIVSIEKPDILFIFNDPRFYIWLFEMDNEVRPHMKIVYWHLWDNEPFPKFNLKWYECCDEIITISKFSHELLNSGEVANTFVPHGLSGKEYYKISEKRRTVLRNDFLQQSGLPNDTEFIILTNNRNIERKRLPDTILAFKRFHKDHPKSVLVMCTDIIDQDGVDLQRFTQDVEPGNEPIVFFSGQLPSERMLTLYNISDVYVTIPFNEGFGLSIAEALLCELPVIATATGGIIEQMKLEPVPPGILLTDTTRVFFGNVRDPYIYRDYVKINDVVDALTDMYSLRGTGECDIMGARGRKHILENYNDEVTTGKMVSVLNDAVMKPKTYQNFVVLGL